VLVRNNEVGGWKDLQEKVKQLLGELGYFTESPFKVELAGRGQKEVDVFAEDRSAAVKTIFIVECKWWESSVPQDTVHAFHTVVNGCGANTGFIVSKVGFQSGAYEAAQNTNIRLLTFEDLQHRFGPQWFYRHKSLLEPYVEQIRQMHHLHLDQWSPMPIHNNKRFHTQELERRFAKVAKHGVDLMLQAGSKWPQSYEGPQPVQMAVNPIDLDSPIPPGQLWHTVPTVREYFRGLLSGLSAWEQEWKALQKEAHESFEKLPEEEQDKSFDAARPEMLEETPVRVLRSKIPPEEYRRLLKLLATGITDQFDKALSQQK
jgi:hypothetical protein